MKDDDFKLLRGFADERTDGQTFVIVESLSRLKMQYVISCTFIVKSTIIWIEFWVQYELQEEKFKLCRFTPLVLGYCIKF